jgi:uncharacterized membrane protein YgdD (TMEM256/DUF423 family)
MRERLLIAIAALSGVAAVIADALAAHMTSAARTGPFAADLAAGSRHGLLHALALLVVVLIAATRIGASVVAQRCCAVAGWCFAVGLLLFPPSLYLLGAGAPAAFGYLAPLGGMLFIAGWLTLLLLALGER